MKEGGRPTTVNGNVPPRRLPNAARRPREYLTPEEAERLITTARKRVGARNPHRDATMIMLAYRHGLRASEVCALRWDMLDLSQGRFHVTRRKNGRPGVHLLRGQEIRALRQLKREQVCAAPKSFEPSARSGTTGCRSSGAKRSRRCGHFSCQIRRSLSSWSAAMRDVPSMSGVEASSTSASG